MGSDEKEILEAIDAASKALKCLKNAEVDLRSASGWGIVDLLGGGLLSSIIKHNDMSDAKKHIEESREALKVFSDELKDVDESLNINLGEVDLMYFADVFLDNGLIDLLVQGSIADAHTKVTKAIKRVEALKEQLNGLLKEL